MCWTTFYKRPPLQRSTVVLLNGCLGLLLLPQFVMLRAAIKHESAVGHVCLLITLTLVLLVAINWCGPPRSNACPRPAFNTARPRMPLPALRARGQSAVRSQYLRLERRFISQVGLVSASEQRDSLFGAPAETAADADAPASGAAHGATEPPESKKAQ